MWVLFAIVTVGYIIYLITKDYKEEVIVNVTNQGGMQEKYKELIDYLTSHSSNRITRLTKDSITISSLTMTLSIDYVGGNTEVKVFGETPPFGRFQNKWKFLKGYPQKKMILDIENYFDWIAESVNNNLKEEILGSHTIEQFREIIGQFEIKLVFDKLHGNHVKDGTGKKVAIIDESIKSEEDIESAIICLCKRDNKEYYKLCDQKKGDYPQILFTL